MEKLHKTLRILMIFLAGIIVGLIIFRWFLARQTKQVAELHSHEHRTTVPPATYGTIGDFNFTDRSGKKVSRADLEGSYWLADFIFTRCMGPCPMLTTQMARLDAEFSHRKDLQFVSFTVDPDFDTPAVLAKYADSYGADKTGWYFLNGPKDKMYDLIRDSFHLAVEPDEKDPMQVVHSLSFVLVGKKGEILGYYNTNDPETLKTLREKLAGLS